MKWTYLKLFIRGPPSPQPQLLRACSNLFSWQPHTNWQAGSWPLTEKSSCILDINMEDLKCHYYTDLNFVTIQCLYTCTSMWIV